MPLFTECPRETVRKVSVEPESKPYGRTKRAKKPYFAVSQGQKVRPKCYSDPFSDGF